MGLGLGQVGVGGLVFWVCDLRLAGFVMEILCILQYMGPTKACFGGDIKAYYSPYKA